MVWKALGTCGTGDDRRWRAGRLYINRYCFKGIKSLVDSGHSMRDGRHSMCDGAQEMLFIGQPVMGQTISRPCQTC